MIGVKQHRLVPEFNQSTEDLPTSFSGNVRIFGPEHRQKRSLNLPGPLQSIGDATAKPTVLKACRINAGRGLDLRA